MLTASKTYNDLAAEIEARYPHADTDEAQKTGRATDMKAQILLWRDEIERAARLAYDLGRKSFAALSKATSGAALTDAIDAHKSALDDGLVELLALVSDLQTAPAYWCATFRPEDPHAAPVTVNPKNVALFIFNPAGNLKSANAAARARDKVRAAG